MSQSLKEISEESLRLKTLIHSAIAGASVAAVVQLGGREQLDLPLLVSLAFFAITLPTSLLVILLLKFRSQEQARQEAGRLQSRPWPAFRYVMPLQYLAYVACFAGFLALFWHFHPVIGLIFLVASVLAFGTALAADSYLSRQKFWEPVTEDAPGEAEAGSQAEQASPKLQQTSL